MKSLVIVIVGCSLAAAPLRAQPGDAPMQRRLPAGAVGTATARLVARYNAGALTAPRWMRWRQLVGPVEVRGVQVLDGGAVRAWVRGRVTHGWLGFEIRPDSAGRVNEASVPVFWLGGRPPAALRDSSLRAPPASLDARINAYLDAVSAAGFFSGTVVVGRHGRPIVERASGFAQREQGIRNTPATRFSIASVGKVFTAAAIARLVTDGRVRWTDTVGAFLPAYPIIEARSATIGQLLSHAAGLGRSDADWIASREPRTLEQLVQAIAAPQDYPPGSSSGYSNEAYVVAGRIVELASGMPYEEYVRRFVFAPAGMTATDWTRIDDPAPGRATPYSNFVRTDSGQVYVPGPRRDASALHGLRGTPAGGAYATAPDLLRFGAALQAGRIADTAVVATMFAPLVRTPVGIAYGNGFQLAADAPRIVSKGGNAQGASAEIVLYLDDDLVVVVLSNFDSSAQVVAQGIRELIGN